MATITLPVATLTGYVPMQFDIEHDLSFGRRIVRQGKGARKAWREQVRDLKFKVYESDAVVEWNEMRRSGVLMWGADMPMYGIRAAHRRKLRREAAFASARQQVGGLIIPDEHDPRL